MNDFSAPGLPMFAELPASIALFVLLLFGLRIAGTRSARFVVFAIWVRIMLSTYHVYTFRHVGPLSINALGSASLFLLGMVVLPKRYLVSKVLMPFYVVIAAICLSAAVNHLMMSAFEPITKFGLVIALALHTRLALENGDRRKFVLALLVSFAPLLVFQALSILFHVPKRSESDGSASYIGGYYHEAAFSSALLALIVVLALARSISPRLKMIGIPLLLVSIVLANYRTAILAALPLLGFYLLYGVSRPVDRNLRGMVVVLLGVCLVVIGGLSLMTLDRFKDLQTVVHSGTALIKPVDQFGTADRELLSGRFHIWSGYYYTWKASSELRHLVGFGPDSWRDYFPLYAHNTFVDYLFEYGIIGLAALVGLFGWGLALALRAGQERLKLLAAHLSFLILNLATMPLWMIEGNIVFGLLWGYTLYYRRTGIRVSVRERPRPQLKAVSI